MPQEALGVVYVEVYVHADERTSPSPFRAGEELRDTTWWCSNDSYYKEEKIFLQPTKSKW